jgi:hypothetical protein
MAIVSGSALVTPHAVEVGGGRRPKFHRSAAVEVAETLVGGLGTRRTERSQAARGKAARLQRL